MIKKKAEIAFQRLSRLYIQEASGNLTNVLDETKARKVRWLAVSGGHPDELGFLLESNADYVVVVRVFDGRSDDRRDWGIVEKQ